MVMGVEVVAEPVLWNAWPAITCPTCRLAILTGDRSFKTKRSAESKRFYKEEEGFEPDWIHGVFNGVLTCSNAQCEETVVVAGVYKIVPAQTRHEQYTQCLQPRYFDPPLCLMELPSGVPEETARAVADASSLILINPGAAANRLRQAVESLLTARKVKRFETRTNRKTKANYRHRLSLHERIAILRISIKDAADLLEAVKWIGNDGSHEASLTVEQVLQGVRIFEVALQLMYDTRNLEARKAAKQIIRRKGIR